MKSNGKIPEKHVGIKFNLKRNSIGLLMGSFYIPTGTFAIISIGSYIIIEFPIRLRLLQVRLSIIFEKMFEYFDYFDYCIKIKEYRYVQTHVHYLLSTKVYFNMYKSVE